MTWEELTREVVNRRLAGEDMHSIADALDSTERQCAAIYASWRARRGGVRKAMINLHTKSADDVLAEWKQNARAVIEGSML